MGVKRGALKETLQRINSSLDAMADNAIYVRRNEMAAELQQLNTNQTMDNIDAMIVEKHS
ncbi:MAG: hypothetical protein AAES65_21760 [Candidatus Thiodiazotropha sp. (ex. Lucinoma kazani)]